MMNLDSAEKEKKNINFPVTGGHFFLTGNDFFDQTGHNNFEVWICWSLDFFVLFSGSEAIYPLLCLALHTKVHYLISVKKKLTEECA